MREGVWEGVSDRGMEGVREGTSEGVREGAWEGGSRRGSMGGREGRSEGGDE